MLGISEELRTGESISGEKWETTKLFAAYSANLHMAAPDEEANRLLVKTLERLADRWSIKIGELSIEDTRRLKILDNTILAFAAVG